MPKRLNTWILIIGIFALYGLDVGWINALLPWDNEVRELVYKLIDWGWLLVAIYLLSDALKDVVTGVTDFVKWVGKIIGGILSAIVFLLFVFPVILGNTFLLGPGAHWIWANMFGSVVLLVLTITAYWARGGFTAGVDRKILGAFIFIGLISIFGTLFLYMNQEIEYFNVAIKSGNNRAFFDPPKLVQVKEGDIVRFSVDGRVKASAVAYPPKGDTFDLIAEGMGWRPRGQVEIRVYKDFNNYWRVPIEVYVVGPDTILGYNIGDLLEGNYLFGVARVPKGANGTLGIGFFNLVPDEGSLKLRAMINPQNTLIGKLSGVGWLMSLIGVIAFTAIYWIGVSLLARSFSGVSVSTTGVAGIPIPTIVIAHPVLRAFILILSAVLYAAIVIALFVDIGNVGRGDVNKWLTDHGFEAGKSGGGGGTPNPPPSTSATSTSVPAPPPAAATAPAVDPNCIYQPAPNEQGQGLLAFAVRRASYGCKEVVFVPVASSGFTGTVFFPHSPCGEAQRPVVRVVGQASVSQDGRTVDPSAVSPDSWFFINSGGPGSALVMSCPTS